ncbi:MAG: scyllo-inositol 2-dehydrogenase (NADP+) [Oceanospirillaceae bacterium]
MIKVAVVGYGLSANIFHLPFITHSEQFSLAAISSSQIEVVDKKYPQIDVYQNAEQMVTNSATDLVIITSPNNTHFSLAKLALNAGKHVLLEKPMTTTSSQALELVKLAKSKSLVLSVYQNRRWDGDFLTLQRIINSGSLGKIKVFNSHFDRFRPLVRSHWREQIGEGTGVLYDLGSHLIDQALHLFGAPLSLTANCKALRDDANVTDYFKVMLHYANMEIVLQSSPFAANPKIRFQLQGTKGSYVKHGLDPQEEQLRAGLSPAVPAFGVEPPAHFGVQYLADSNGQQQSVKKIETIKGCYAEFYSQLAMAISSDLTVPVSAISATKVIKIIELAIKSSEQGCTVSVDLSDLNTQLL